MLASLALWQVMAFGLVLARIAGFVAVSPFPTASVSRTQRVALVAVLSWAASAYVPIHRVPRALDLTMLLAASTEVGCGLVMGSAFRFVYVAADFLGHIASQAIGLSMASVLNPAIGGEDVALSRIVTLLAELLALTAGVHRVALSYVLHSFGALPVGAGVDFPDSSRILVELVIRSLAVGVQLAMPVVAVCLVVHIGLAMIARAAPALQILHVGLGLLLATGALTLLRVLPDVGRSLLEYYALLGPMLDELLLTLRHQAP